jgi:hypothetical protein
MNTIETTFGLIWRSDFRKYLNRLKTHGLKFEYQEQKGWFFNTFVITGDEDALYTINKIIRIIRA